jgi:hypothetical protein
VSENGDRQRREKVYPGKPIEKKVLIADDYVPFGVKEGTEYLTSANLEIKKISTSLGLSYLILDHDAKMFMFVSASPKYPARNDVLDKYTKGNRLLLEKFKQFLNVTLTRQDPKIVIATTKGKGTASA